MADVPAVGGTVPDPDLAEAEWWCRSVATDPREFAAIRYLPTLLVEYDRRGAAETELLAKCDEWREVYDERDNVINTLRAQRVAVLALHRRMHEEDWDGNAVPGADCIECDERWPCSTLRALGVSG